MRLGIYNTMMKKYNLHTKPKSKLGNILLTLVVVLVVVGAVGFLVFHRVYTSNLRAVDPSSHNEIDVGIPTGSSVNEITILLKDKKLIRSTWAFKQYVLSNGYASKLQAGTYRFYTDESAQKIVDKLISGEVAVDLFTILPGQRIDQLKQDFLDAGYSAESVDKAFDPATYAGNPALVDKPEGASLEGYLYPDSYQITDTTTPEDIVRAALSEMSKYLTSELKTGIEAQGLSVYQGITLASIVEREVASQTDRAKAAQVFLLRMKKGMRLESDVTVLYGMEVAGKSTGHVDTSFDSPYNTFLIDGVPIGPISNVTDSGLQAVANPADTDYLYFVAGDGDDYGNTYFSHTLAEHNAAAAAHCSACSK